MNYQPHLKDFSARHYELFDELALQLDLQGSINDLFDGEIINKTENSEALHHQYRFNQKAPEFDFKQITDPFIKRIKKDGFKNIISFGIGGSYEGPKLLQEFTNKQSLKLNYYFVSGPDRDEFDSILKPLRGEKNFYIFSSKSLSTDETLLCLKWLGREKLKEFNSYNCKFKKSCFNWFLECVVPFPESVGGRYSIWSPISLSVGIEIVEILKRWLSCR